MANNLISLIYSSQLILAFLKTHQSVFCLNLYWLVTKKQGEDTSKGYFKGMMINELVHIERSIDAENTHLIDFLVDRCIQWKFWEQVCAVNDGVKMNDAHMVCPPVSQFRVYNPHTSGQGCSVTSSVWDSPDSQNHRFAT